MTRDFNLIRQILFQAEKAPSGEPMMSLTVDSELDHAVLAEHLEIMLEAGLIEGKVLSSRPLTFYIERLTWTGHDFVNKARNDTIWKKVMADAKEKGMSVTMKVLDGLLTKAAEKYAGLGD